VENASFMPWLVGTALIHSAIVTEKRGALTGWTVFLALAAFSFSMLGAFLVRSGVLTSVHAFAVDPARGVLLLSILGLSAGAGFSLFAWRAPGLQPGGLFALVSREGALVLNNLFLAGAVVTVALGTLYPLVRQALTGEAISVGAPYFALTFGPLMGACLLILPVGPFLAWKRGEAGRALQRLWLAAAAALAAGLLGAALISPRHAFAAVGLAMGVWLVAGALSEVAERVRLGHVPWRESGRRLRHLPLSAWGMGLAHIGLGVFVLGASTELAWRVESARLLQPGQTMAVAGYALTLDEVQPAPGPNFSAERARLSVRPPSGGAFTMEPERRFYPATRQTTSKVAIRRAGTSDLYVVLGEAQGGSGWLVRVFYNPWARLIFWGPALMALGGGCSLADRRLRLAAGRRGTVLQGQPA
jgi:cytochrome c-type biogenesis protein CcmF